MANVQSQMTFWATVVLRDLREVDDSVAGSYPTWQQIHIHMEMVQLGHLLLHQKLCSCNLRQRPYAALYSTMNIISTVTITCHWRSTSKYAHIYIIDTYEIQS